VPVRPVVTVSALRIVVLEKGRAVEFGRPVDLYMQRNFFYRMVQDSFLNLGSMLSSKEPDQRTY